MRRAHVTLILTDKIRLVAPQLPWDLAFREIAKTTKLPSPVFASSSVKALRRTGPSASADLRKEG